MTPHSRRALALASALVAAGLTLGTLPGTALADVYGTDGARVLTEEQARSLEQRIQIDPYANADTSAASVGGEQDGDASDAPLSSLDDATAGPALSARTTTLETSRGMAATTALSGTGGGYAVLHSLGSVARHSADGQEIWRRDNASLYTEWQVKPVRPWLVEPGPARITMGYNAVSPFTDASEHGFATGDLTGDGVADVAFTAEVGVKPSRAFTVPGSTLSTGTFVTVLDGATGRTLWSKLFADAQQIALVDGTLVVADQPVTNSSAPATATATLQAFRFSYTAGALGAERLWTYDTGVRAARWGDLLQLGSGRLAVSWNVRKTATAAGESHTAVLDTDAGTALWKTGGALYSRQLRLDSARERLVALEQADATDGVKYQLAAYALPDGSRSTLDTRVNALALGLTTGDVSGDKLPEYVVSEDTLDPNVWVNATTVRTLGGEDGATELWSDTTKREAGNFQDGPSAFGLKVVAGQILASYTVTEGHEGAANYGGSRYARIVSFAGKSGAVRWEHTGPVASQMYAEPFREDDAWYARTVDADQNVHTYKLDNGRRTDLTALQGDLSVVRAVDVNGDGRKDLVAGGESHGLWAYDGPSLVAGKPELLWKKDLPGRVYGLQLADTDGDGKPELVVAGGASALVLRVRDGRTLADIDGQGQLVRSVTAGDADGDGRAEVFVPTDRVRAYSGTGRPLWTYAPEGPAVYVSDLAFQDGRVYGTYNTHGTLEAADITTNGFALEAGSGHLAWTADPTYDGSPIYGSLIGNGTFASKDIPYADGHAVVMVWTVEDAIGPKSRVEIRDGRTGEVLHAANAGGFNTVGNWTTGPEGLVLTGTASFTTYGPGGEDSKVFTLPPVHNGTFLTGPGGQRLLAAGGEAGWDVWDPSILAGTVNYPSSLVRANAFSTRGITAADLDGDGEDELIGTPLDTVGHDQAIEQSGARYRTADTSLHGLVVVKLGRP
ncbi:FG-GAP repeat domain-containing protein [Streptomyces hydrogenans]|uniref:FG-GAP repeat domain-containing protein n=1 Tax=Streptomyces hydrogenans TaxID=1873719 RepID=UPI0036A8B532